MVNPCLKNISETSILNNSFIIRTCITNIHTFSYLHFRNDDKTSVEVAYISKLRQAVPQCCAVGAKNILLLAFGSTLGFSTILIPALQREDTDIKVTTEELTWISKNLFANIVLRII